MMFFVSLLIIVLLPLSQLFVTSRQKRPSAATQITGEHETNLLECGIGGKLRKVSNANEIKIISYNIRYRSGPELTKLIQLLREDPEIGNATVIGLQEVDRQKKRSGNTNTARAIADALEMNYAWAAPPTAKENQEEETGVAILSSFPISHVRRIVLPHAGPDQRRRVGLGATVKVGGTDVRVYSLHAETRIALDKKIEQMDAILQDLKGFPENMPAIVVGDFNTWEPDAEKKTMKLFSSAGMKTPFGGQTTFSRRALFIPLELRLDWAWFRNLQVVTYGIDRKIGLSDHWPLWVNVKLPAQKETAAQRQ